MLDFQLVRQEIEHFLYVKDFELLAYSTFVLVILALSYGGMKYWKRWTRGNQKILVNNITRRLGLALKYGLLQYKVVDRPFVGIMHLLLYVGIAALVHTTILRLVDNHRILGLHPLVGNAYLWYKLVANVAGMMVTFGAIMGFYRRLTKGTRDLPNTLSDNILLADLAIIMLTGFVLDSISTMTYRTGWIGPFDPVGSLMIPLFINIDKAVLNQLYRATWLFHLLIVTASVALIPHSKLRHLVISAFANTFMARPENPAHPSAFEGLTQMIENESFELGIKSLEQTSWKQRMDFDSCVSCARCHNSCPANLSENVLSPMELMRSLKSQMDKGNWGSAIWPETIEPKAIWSCVTCGACVDECPFLIDQAETIMELRRGMHFEDVNVQRDVKLISANITNHGNPYGFSRTERQAWLSSLEEKALAELARPDQRYDYLYWIGCVTAYDPNLRNVAESTLRLLKKAGQSVAVLVEEVCCGDPARRVGDELMFSQTVGTNKKLLDLYKYRSVLTSCPHCFNSLKNEYKQYGCQLSVEHHAQTLYELVRKGRLKPTEPVKLKLTFHDSCYLGRWNKMYREPRDIVAAIPNASLLEMRRNREKAFCCGGGGARLFYEVDKEERISSIRIREAMETKADALLVTCPYCNSMFRGEAKEIRILDIAELLDQAIKP